MKQHKKGMKFRAAVAWRRALSWVLTLVMIVGLMPQTGITVRAESGDVELSSQIFTDPVFLEFVTQFDTDKDGKLSAAERSADKAIHMVCQITGKSMRSLAGLEYFTELESLDCGANYITELDVSSFQKLTILDCGHNYYLEDLKLNSGLLKLSCGANLIETLDVRDCKNLTELECYGDNLLELNVIGCKNLTELRCSNAAAIKELDLRGCKNLTELNCVRNAALEKLDLSECENLKRVDCRANSQLEDLDLSNTKVYYLSCSDNNLDSLTLSGKETYLDVTGNPLSEIDLTENTTGLKDAIALGAEEVTGSDGEIIKRYRNGNCYLYADLDDFVYGYLYTVNLSVASDSVGTGTLKGNGTYPQTKTVTISATPAQGYGFDCWTDSDTGAVVSKQKDYAFQIMKDCNYTASFFDTATVNIAETNRGTTTGAGDYAYGSEVTLTATPKGTYGFAGWYKVDAEGNNPVLVSDEPTYTFIPTEKESFYMATFSRVMITVVASPEEGGTVSGGGRNPYGAQVTLTATPNEGWGFYGWTGVGIDGTSENPLIINATASRTYKALFRQVTIDVATEDSALGSVTGSGVYAYGSTVTVAAQVEGAYGFKGWYDGETMVSSDNPYSFTAYDDVALEARFHRAEITLVTDPTNGGTVNGAGIYHDGNTVTVTASPAEGYGFAGWYEGETKVSSNNPYSFTADGNRTLEARFRKFKVTATSSKGGSVSGGKEYPYGSTATVTATPAEGYGFMGWYQGENLVSTENPYSFTVEEETTLSAQFAKQKLTISLDSTQGSVKVNGTDVTSGQKLEFPYGSSITLTATPASTYGFVGWYEKDVEEPVFTSPNFKVLLDRDLNLTAEFATYTVNVGTNPELGGTVTGAGNYAPGSLVTLTATPSYGYLFMGWHKEGDEAVLSPDGTYQFTAEASVNLVAEFKKPELTLIVTPNNNHGTVIGGGVYNVGETVTIETAPVDDKHVFVGWYENGELVTADNKYSFVLDRDRSLNADYKQRVTLRFSSGNEGLGTMDPVEILDRSVYTLPECEFTPFLGYEFDHWEYGHFNWTFCEGKPGDQWEVEEFYGLDEIEFKAIWKELSYSVELSEENFPDKIFREKLANYDADHNGALSSGELARITNISILDEKVTSLQGIEKLIYLKRISISGTLLTSLDVSQCATLESLSCWDNELTEIKFGPANTALEWVSCNDNKIKKLNLSELPSLNSISCSRNELTEIKVGLVNTALEELYCSNNQLKRLDLTGCTALKKLSCNSNQLTTLKFASSAPLEEIECAKNSLRKLDVSGFSALKTLSCSVNELTELKLSAANTALEAIACAENQLTELDLSGLTSLKNLVCRKNQLTKLTFGSNDVLETVYCSENQLTTLDLSSVKALANLFCSQNKLTKITLGNGKTLKYFECDENQLEELKVSDQKGLLSLSCNQNPLKALDVSKNTALQCLYCNNCALTELDTSNNKALLALEFENNQISSYSPSKNKALQTLVVKDNLLNRLQIGNCEELNYLDIRGNKDLRFIDISKNDPLKEDGDGTLLKDDYQTTYEEEPDTVTIIAEISPEGAGSVSGTGKWIVNQMVTLEAIPATGYCFVGWTEDDNPEPFSENPELSFKAVKNRILTACFEKGCAITFNPGEGSGEMKPVTVGVNATYQLPVCSFERPEGKVFAYWNYGKPGDEITVKTDTTLYAEWEKGYHVSVAANMSGDFYQLEGAGDYLDGEDVTIHVTIDSHKAYVVAAMMIDNTVVSTSDTYTFKPEKDTVVQIMLVESYFASFIPGLGTGEDYMQIVGVSQYLTMPEFTFTPPAGKVFKCWKDNYGKEHCPGEYYVQDIAENVVFAATYKKETDPCTVRFDLNGHGTQNPDAQPETQTVEYGGKATKPATDPSEPGWFFRGWEAYVTVDGTKQWVLFDFENDVVQNDLCLRARWEVNINEQVVIISFDAGEGTGNMNSMLLVSGTPYTLPECGFTAPEGCVFDCWKLDEYASDKYYPGDPYKNPDGVGTVCFLAIWREKPGELTATFGHTCEFQNRITMNYKITVDLSEYDDFWLAIERQTYKGAGEEFYWETAEVRDWYQDPKDKRYVFAFDDIAAAEMGEVIRAKLVAEKDGETYESNVDVYSLKTYAYNRIAKSSDVKFKKLMVDMLNYGAAAQIYFGKNTGNLVNADLTEAERKLGTQKEVTPLVIESVTDNVDETARIVSKSVAFKSGVELNAHVNYDAEPAEDEKVWVELTYVATSGDSKRQVVTRDKFVRSVKDGVVRYSAAFDIIATPDFGKEVTLKVFRTVEEDGVSTDVQISETYTYSLETYAANRLANSENKNFKALLREMLKYERSAKEFFESQQH